MKKILAVSVLGALTLSSVAYAKGHDQGFGAGLAGQATAGLVDNGQKNAGGMGSATAYGTTDAKIEAQAGERDKKEAAMARNATRAN